MVCHAGLPEKYHGRTSGRVRSHALYGDTTGETDEFGLPVRYPWAEDYRGRAAVVYGHTPVPTTSWINNTICLDTGAVFGGAMTALRWPEREIVDVPAERVWYEPVKPLLTDAPGGREGRPLDLDDVTGRRIVETSRMGRLAVREENAAAALEVMSRFAVDPRLLGYLPPTMSPCATSREEGYLEHPAEAFAAFREDGVRAGGVRGEAHGLAGGRAGLPRRRRPRTPGSASSGVTGTLHTRTGRPFFDDPAVTEQVLARLREAVTAAGLWDELGHRLAAARRRAAAVVAEGVRSAAQAVRGGRRGGRRRFPARARRAGSGGRPGHGRVRAARQAARTGRGRGRVHRGVPAVLLDDRRTGRGAPGAVPAARRPGPQPRRGSRTTSSSRSSTASSRPTRAGCSRAPAG